MNTVLEALRTLIPYSARMDVATGTFELGSMLELDLLWQDLQRIRILMGDETTRRTKREMVEAIVTAANESIESEKERDDSLTGLPAIRQALTEQRILSLTYSPPIKFTSRLFGSGTTNYGKRLRMSAQTC